MTAFSITNREFAILNNRGIITKRDKDFQKIYKQWKKTSKGILIEIFEEK